MTSSIDIDPALSVRGRGAIPGRRATPRTPVGGGSRAGAGHLVGGGPAPRAVATSSPGLGPAPRGGFSRGRVVGHAD
jgi:hypothetical protein